MLTTAKMKKLRQIISDPARFEESLALLSGLSSNTDKGAALSISPASYKALVDKSEAGPNTDEVAAFNQMIQAYEHPCLVIQNDGGIVTANGAANTMLGALASGNIDGIGVSSWDGMPLGPLVSELVSSYPETQESITKVRLSKTERFLSLVMVVVDLGLNGPKHVLAFLVDVAGSPVLREHIYQEYQLTNNERYVLEQFVGGQTLAEIADARGRSITTVRKQFYTVMEKFGVSSQADLLREIFLKSNVLLTAHPMLKQAQHPHRREVNVLRPQGRTVDVTLAGDMSGEPVVVANSLFLRCFPARIEKMFKDAGLLVISIAAPCFGGTSPPIHEDDQAKCHAEDIEAVLDQLSIEQATFFATDYRFPASLVSATFIPERMKQIVATNVLLPSQYQENRQSNSTVFLRIQDLAKSSDLMRSLVARIGTRAFSILGPRGVLPLLYRNNPELLETSLQPDNLAEIDAAFKCMFAQGLRASIRGFELINTNWSELIANCVVPIALYEGTQSEIYHADTMRRFADKYSDKVHYTELDQQLNNIIYGQPDLLISMMKTDVPTHKNNVYHIKSGTG